MMCPKCGTENETGVRFCAACGTMIGAQVTSDSEVGVLSRTCSYCGGAVSAKALFCSYCGRSTSVQGAHTIRTRHVGSTGQIVTLGRKYIATGLLVTGLYLVWSGIYSSYYGFKHGWQGWEGIDYMDVIFAFLVGFVVITTGLISFTKK